MRWEDERYVRLFTRDTTDWLALSWQAQGLFALLLRKVDRAGILELGKRGLPAVAAHIGGPAAWPTLEPVLQELLADGCVVHRDGALVVPNFVEAQETPSSDAQRQRDRRERARDRKLADERGDAGRHAVSRTQDVPPQEVAEQPAADRHAASRDVTPNQPSVPSEPAEPAPPPPPPAPPPRRSRAARDDLEGFAEFWADYPRRVDRADAEKAWRALGPDEALRARIHAAIHRQRRPGGRLDGHRTKDGRSATPYPATWLRKRGFDDEPEDPPAAAPDAGEWRPRLPREHAVRGGRMDGNAFIAEPHPEPKRLSAAAARVLGPIARRAGFAIDETGEIRTAAELAAPPGGGPA